MRKLTLLTTSLIFLLSNSIALAQDSVVGEIKTPPGIIQSPKDTGSFITAIVIFITVIAGLFALWQFLTGGFGFISSGGDKTKVQQSTQQIMMAILGLTIIASSFILGSLIGRLLFGADFNLFAPILQTVK